MKKYVTIKAVKELNEKTREMVWEKIDENLLYIEQYVQINLKKGLVAKVNVYETYMIMDII
ncbi:hypothetical protein [Enterococcus faecium]|uniref:hypothetical protein n=1 Tax=Enterococcus faecium TaxID=1352 RepID=UPI000D943F3D|nr:hypothetical protein [Enterococcus faecium]PWS24663.1 hypothetical protein DKP78_05480 [Enterococcus faecium]